MHPQAKDAFAGQTGVLGSVYGDGAFALTTAPVFGRKLVEDPDQNFAGQPRSEVAHRGHAGLRSVARAMLAGVHLKL